MEKLKKKSLKFDYEMFSRDCRHAETLKARESSRFKRLSLLRSITDVIEESTESMEVLCTKDTSAKNAKPNEQTKNVQKPSQKCQPTRGEMLQKWRQEKLLRKQLEIKSKKAPFYVGGSTTNQQLLKKNPGLKNSLCMKSSFINQSKSRLNITKDLKSKISAPSTSIQSSRIPNVSKLAASSLKTVNSGLKVGMKPATATGKLPKANEISAATVKNQVNMTASSSKFVNNGLKAASIKPPTTGILFSKKNDIPKVKNQVYGTSSVPKTVNSGLKVPSVKVIPSTGIKLSKVNETCATKVKSQVNVGSTSSRLAPSRLPCKPVSKVATVPKSVSGTSKYSKGIPVSKPSNQVLPCSKANIIKPLNKPVPKVAPKSSENCTTLNKVNSEEPISNCGPEQSGLSVQKLDIPDITVGCDDISFVSSSTSFAPVDFKFQPPAGVDIFMFDDDPFEAIENVKKKFMCRTSTPTKAAVEAPASLSSQETIAIKATSPEKPTLYLPETPDLKQIKQIIENHVKSMKLEDGKQDKDDIPDDEELLKNVDKSTDAKSKRVSVLKGVRVLNAIHETSEVEGVLDSPINNVSENPQNFVFTPRRSARLHSIQQAEASNNSIKSPVKKEVDLKSSTLTPRRSLRLQKAACTKVLHLDDTDILSPFKGKKSILSNFAVRPSTTLIDLDFDDDDDLCTPAGGRCQNTDITSDFEKMRLNFDENTDPNKVLIDFEKIPEPEKIKSKKVSLLYSPKKRASVRMSIRGDLMSFSPSNS